MYEGGLWSDTPTDAPHGTLPPLAAEHGNHPTHLGIGRADAVFPGLLWQSADRKDWMMMCPSEF